MSQSSVKPQSLLTLLVFQVLAHISLASTVIGTTAPQWQSSPYFRASRYQIVSTHLQPTDPPATYTFLFTPVFQNMPNVAYGIKEYRGKDTFYE